MAILRPSTISDRVIQQLFRFYPAVGSVLAWLTAGRERMNLKQVLALPALALVGVMLMELLQPMLLPGTAT